MLGVITQLIWKLFLNHFIFYLKKIKFCLVGDINKILKYQKLHKLNYEIIPSEKFSFQKDKLYVFDTKIF